jgi:ribonuclease J
MKVIVHRGTHRIGGICIECRTAKTRIIIDVGMPLTDKGGKPFDMKNYEKMDGKQLETEGVLPAVPGLYPWHENGGTIDGIFLTHYHLDHVGFLKHVRQSIMVYLGEITETVMDGGADIFHNPRIANPHKPIQDMTPVEIGDTTITPYLMDHSAMDAYAFLVDGEGKRAFFTGDFRGHGRKESLTERLIRNPPKDISCLFIEGTMMGRSAEPVKREKEIENEILAVARGSKGPVFINFSALSVDRLVSFYRAAVRSGRILLVDIYTAMMLSAISTKIRSIPSPGGRFKNLRVYYPRYILHTLVEINGPYETVYKFKDEQMKDKEVAGNTKVIMMVRPQMTRDIEKILAINPRFLEDSALIYSQWHGYLEQDKMKEMVGYFTGHGSSFHHIHTSGHADIKTLRRLIRAMAPAEVIPYHTESPQNFHSLSSRVKIAEDGMEIEI